MHKNFRNKTGQLVIIQIGGQTLKIAPDAIISMEESLAGAYMAVLAPMETPIEAKPVPAKPLIVDSPGLPLKVEAPEVKKELLIDSVPGETLKPIIEEKKVDLGDAPVTKTKTKKGKKKRLFGG